MLLVSAMAPEKSASVSVRVHFAQMELELAIQYYCTSSRESLDTRRTSGLGAII